MAPYGLLSRYIHFVDKCPPLAMNFQLTFPRYRLKEPTHQNLGSELFYRLQDPTHQNSNFMFFTI